MLHRRFCDRWYIPNGVRWCSPTETFTMKNTFHQSKGQHPRSWAAVHPADHDSDDGATAPSERRTFNAQMKNYNHDCITSIHRAFSQFPAGLSIKWKDYHKHIVLECTFTVTPYKYTGLPGYSVTSGLLIYAIFIPLDQICQDVWASNSEQNFDSKRPRCVISLCKSEVVDNFVILSALKAFDPQASGLGP